MFREFFCEGPRGRKVWAWSGLLVFLGHQAFKAYLAWAINSWYERFYDILQNNAVYSPSGISGISGTGGISGISANATTLSNASHISAAAMAADESRLKMRTEVWDSLLEFGRIVAPAVFVHPIAGLWRNWWVFTWRRVLMTSYLHRWNTAIPPIEGASQRVHEDTQRFASGIQSCVAVVLQSIFTLVVFCPVLYALDPALMGIATVAAVGGLSISVVVGWPLVDLEVNNQKVEAELRKKLVLLETEPSQVHMVGTPYTAFTRTFLSLASNYKRLYLSFAGLATWLSLYEQIAVILPYLLVAPRLFAARVEDHLTLGQLIKVSNSFGRVFDSLNVVSDRWLEINEWRSCVRRLREFEQAVSNRSPASARALPTNPCSMELSEMSEMSSTRSVARSVVPTSRLPAEIRTGPTWDYDDEDSRSDGAK